MKILAISGSLRHHSTNTNVLLAAKLLAPEGVQIELYNGLADLPHFNPDLESDEPEPVTNLRRAIATADGLLICSPEYAHGVPGSLKNMLDWLVGGSEFVDKPVALINASQFSTYAQASLIEIVTVMSARLVREASIMLPLRSNRLDAQGLAASPDVADPLRRSLNDFVEAIKVARHTSSE